eukprot:2493236-Amphidinium_carterae.1
MAHRSWLQLYIPSALPVHEQRVDKWPLDRPRMMAWEKEVLEEVFWTSWAGTGLNQRLTPFSDHER